MKKIIYIALVVLMAPVVVFAQGGEDMNRQVDVSKEYAPRVDRAVKLSIAPQMEDTVTLRPEYDYTVMPKSWISGFGVAPIRASQMIFAPERSRYPFYVKAGGGYPGQTLFDIYATSVKPGNAGFGFYANHTGQLADIENVLGEKSAAKSTINSLGLFGKTVFGRMSLSGEIGFDYDVHTYYGHIPTGYDFFGRADTDADTGKKMQHYATPRASVVFGHDFTDLSYLNFRIGADGYYLSDRYDRAETGVKVFAEAGKSFGMHTLGIRGGVDTWKAGKDAKGSNTTFGITPHYRMKGEIFSLSLGLTLAYDMPKGREVDMLFGDIMKRDHALWYWSEGDQGSSYFSEHAFLADDDWGDKFWILPQAEARFTLAGGAFNPYAKLESSLHDNSYRSLSRENPYISTKFRMYSSPGATADYKLHAGFSGSIASAFSYNVYVGGRIWRNYAQATNIMNEVYIPTINLPVRVALMPGDFVFGFIDKLQAFTAGAELEVKYGAFTATLEGEYRKYKKAGDYENMDFLPKYTGSLSLAYKHKEKWSLKAAVALRGEYEFMSNWYPYDQTNVADEFKIEDKAPTAVDVSLVANYNFSDRFGVFVEGRNLANRKLYPYAFYRGVGINVSAGVKLRF